MQQLIWLTVVVALVACKDEEPAKKPAATSSNSGARPAAPPAASSEPPAPAGAAPAPASEEEGSGPVPSCADAIGKSIASFTPGPEAAGIKDRMKAAYIRRCAEDRWPASVLRCYASASGLTGMQLCRGKLPPEQRAKLQTDIMGVMSGGAGGTPAPAGPVPVGGPPAAPAK